MDQSRSGIVPDGHCEPLDTKILNPVGRTAESWLKSPSKIHRQRYQSDHS